MAIEKYPYALQGFIFFGNPYSKKKKKLRWSSVYYLHITLSRSYYYYCYVLVVLCSIVILQNCYILCYKSTDICFFMFMGFAAHPYNNNNCDSGEALRWQRPKKTWGFLTTRNVDGRMSSMMWCQWKMTPDTVIPLNDTVVKKSLTTIEGIVLLLSELSYKLNNNLNNYIKYHVGLIWRLSQVLLCGIQMLHAF